MSQRLDVRVAMHDQVRSRSHAAELIKQGRVRVNGSPVSKPGLMITADAVLDVDADEWVSRGAYKLLGALDDLGVEVPARVLDAGASTGGFTQVLLSRGAQQVYAIDVGHDQLSPIIANDPRVTSHEGLNLRDLKLHHLEDQPVDLIVADVSFISLTMLLQPFLDVLADHGQALLMVKPQFEVGRERLGPGGVVSDPAERQAAVDQVIAAAAELGLASHPPIESRLPGPAGNHEFFVLMHRT